MSGFTVTRLAGARALVSGSAPDEKCILSTAGWDAVKHQLAHKAAEDFYDARAKEFFAPIVEASEAANDLIESTLPKEDDAYVLKLQEPVEGTKAQDGVAIVLDHDAAVLKMIESGNTSRLIWVGSTIEITAEAQATPVPTVNVGQGVKPEAD